MKYDLYNTKFYKMPNLSSQGKHFKDLPLITIILFTEIMMLYKYKNIIEFSPKQHGYHKMEHGKENIPFIFNRI